MTLKKWIAPLAFAAVLPTAFAAPATVTVTSSGTVNSGSLGGPFIAKGTAYQLTLTGAYDTDALRVTTWTDYREEDVYALSKAVLTIGDQSYTLAENVWARVTAKWTVFEGQQRLGVGFDNLDYFTSSHWAYHTVAWPQGDNTLSSLLNGNADLAFAAPFLLNAQVNTYSSGEPVGWLFLTPTDTQIAVAVVPEPQTWAMMLGGLALAGAIARRRRREDQPA